MKRTTPDFGGGRVLTEDARVLLIEKGKAAFTAHNEKTITTEAGKYRDSAAVSGFNAKCHKMHNRS